MQNLRQVIDTDEGVDLMHDFRIKLSPETVEVDDYSEVLRQMGERAAKEGYAVTVVGKCLRLIAVSGSFYSQQGSGGVAHVFYHLQNPAADCKLPDELPNLHGIWPPLDLVWLNLTPMWPPPIFMWSMPEEMIFDLLFSRLRFFAQLDFDVLFALAREHGIHMQWATGRKGEEARTLAPKIPGSPNAHGIVATTEIDGRPQSQTILIGFIGRMLLEFMSPSQFLQLVRRGFPKLTGVE